MTGTTEGINEALTEHNGSPSESCPSISLVSGSLELELDDDNRHPELNLRRLEERVVEAADGAGDRANVDVENHRRLEERVAEAAERSAAAAEEGAAATKEGAAAADRGATASHRGWVVALGVGLVASALSLMANLKTEAPVVCGCPSICAPSKSDEAAAKPVEATAQPVEAPTQPAEAQPAEAPTQPAEAPTQPADAPTQPAEAPTLDALSEPIDPPTPVEPKPKPKFARSSEPKTPNGSWPQEPDDVALATRYIGAAIYIGAAPKSASQTKCTKNKGQHRMNKEIPLCRKDPCPKPAAGTGVCEKSV